MVEIPIILLAAGGSARMGQPKQLLLWGTKTLIEYQVEKFLETGDPVYIVLGSSSGQILPLLKKYPVRVVVNSSWKNGMGTSVASGTKQVLADFPHSSGILYALIDQPLVTLAHLHDLTGLFTPGKNQIIASRAVSGWLGVPALFDSSYFPDLKELSGEQGAKVLIKKYADKVLFVNAGNMLEDLDTPESYHRLSPE